MVGHSYGSCGSYYSDSNYISIAISNLIIVALAILFWQYDIFNRSSTQSPSDETKALLMDDPKVVVTVNGEPIYQKEVDTVVNQSPNIKISEFRFKQ